MAVVVVNRRRRLAKRIMAGFGIALLVGVLMVGVLFRDKLVALASLKQVDDHPLLVMTYKGDYGFDEFLKVGAKSDKELEQFLIKQLVGYDFSLNPVSFGCTAFSAKNDKGEAIFGRNFDWEYSPALLLKTVPKNGYASISIVNLATFGYNETNLPKPFKASSLLTLVAPYLPFEGMNERGLTAAILTVPYAEPPQDDGKITLSTTTAIRMVLDKAADVGEAMALLENYNYHFSEGINCHYLLADSAGRAVVVEFMDGAVQFIESEEPYHLTTNFIMYNGLNIGFDGEVGFQATEFERYDIVKARLSQAGGVISESEAMELLEAVHTPGETQWSAVYNQVTGTVRVSMNMNYTQVHEFKLDMSRP